VYLRPAGSRPCPASLGSDQLFGFGARAVGAVTHSGQRVCRPRQHVARETVTVQLHAMNWERLLMRCGTRGLGYGRPEASIRSPIRGPITVLWRSSVLIRPTRQRTCT